jgi:hypothetical protein
MLNRLQKCESHYMVEKLCADFNKPDLRHLKLKARQLVSMQEVPQEESPS